MVVQPDIWTFPKLLSTPYNSPVVSRVWNNPICFRDVKLKRRFNQIFAALTFGWVLYCLFFSLIVTTSGLGPIDSAEGKWCGDDCFGGHITRSAGHVQAQR